MTEATTRPKGRVPLAIGAGLAFYTEKGSSAASHRHCVVQVARSVGATMQLGVAVHVFEVTAARLELYRIGRHAVPRVSRVESDSSCCACAEQLTPTPMLDVGDNIPALSVLNDGYEQCTAK